MPDQPVVRVGQVWADNSRYGMARNRRIEVVRLETLRRDVWSGAEMRYVTEETPVAACRLVGAGNGRPLTYIRRDRFRPTSTGYRLVEDVPAEATP